MLSPMRLLRWVGVVVFLGLGARGATAAPDDKPAKPDPLATAVTAVELATPGDTAALRAALGGNDPWVVVDALHAKDRVDRAVALADAYDGPDATSLRVYATRRWAEPSGYRARLEDAPQATDGPEAAAARAEALDGGEALPDGVLKVRWLLARGDALLRAGRARDAVTTARDAASLAERLGWTKAALSGYGLVGRASREALDLDGAATAWARAADLLRAQGDDVGRARQLANVALAYRRLGDVTRAVTVYRDALEALGAPATGTPPPPDAAQRVSVRVAVLLDRAIAEGTGGLFARAFEDVSTAMAALDAPDAAEIEPRARALARVRAHGTLATLLQRLGDVTRARANAETALAVLDDEATWKEPVPAAPAEARNLQRAVTRGTLAVCDLLDADYEKADAEFGALRETFLELADLRQSARAHQNRGEVALRRGKWLAARAYSGEAAATLEEVHDAEGALLARGNQAEAMARLGERDAAERLHEDVLEKAARLGLSSIVLEQCVRLARLRLSLGRAADAIKAVERGGTVLTGTFGGLPDADRVGARGLFADLFAVGMQVAASEGDDARFFRYLESDRAGALVDGLSRAYVTARTSDPALEREARDSARRLAVLRAQRNAEAERLATVSPAPLRLDAVGAVLGPLDRAVKEARAQHAEVLREIQRRQRLAAQPRYPQPDVLADAMRGLGPREAYVAYTTVGADAVALVVTHDAVRRVTLGRATAVAALDEVEAWGTPAGTPEEALATAAAATKDAHALVWAPVETALPAAVERVYVSPDAALRRVPFGALAELGRGVRVAYAPSATVLRLLREDGVRRGERVLAFGVSSYGGSPRVPSLLRARDGSALSDLPRAAAEAKAIGDEPFVFVDDDATETRFRTLAKEARRWSAAHFSCHGRVDLLTPSLSSIALRASDEDDGFVTALELLESGLAADVVTLSACDTGWGKGQAGEGIVSLARAFLFAGSPRVVATLWPVEDSAADLFMRAFHAAWKQGRDAEASMKAGVDAVRASPQHLHPKHWAGWVLWGVATDGAPGGS